MKTSQSLANLGAALSKLQATLRGAEKNATNPHFRSEFANLESVWESIREPLAKNGLSVSQLMSSTADGKPALVTMLLHASGEWISGEQLLLPIKQDPQALGSAITYARRYGLAAIIGQIQSDDDGNEASKPSQGAPQPQGATKPQGIDSPMALLVTEAQLKRLTALQLKHGVLDAQINGYLAGCKLRARSELNRLQYDELIRKIENTNKPE